LVVNLFSFFFSGFNMPLIYLGKLQKGRFKDPVCVRVMRKWTFKENMGSGQPLYVGLVLADARVIF
jgi:hypothetical protein